MKRLLLFVIISILVSGPSFAQGLSGETEVGSDGKGEDYFSQYLFYDFKNLNVLTRYFYVNGVLQRGEFAIGPTVALSKDNVLKFQFGGTTDKQVMLAGLLIAKACGRHILYIVDEKLSTQDGPNMLYQKIFVSLNQNQSDSWQFRSDGLTVGTKQVFWRIGLEYQHKLPDKKHIFVAPYYDPIRKSVGGQIGVRFF